VSEGIHLKTHRRETRKKGDENENGNEDSHIEEPD
jgi:hypothetical protein